MRTAVLAVAGLIAVATAVSVPVATAGSGTVTACRSNTGSLVLPGTKGCPKHSSKVALAPRGVTGAAGGKGSPGDRGMPGPDLTTGTVLLDAQGRPVDRFVAGAQADPQQPVSQTDTAIVLRSGLLWDVNRSTGTYEANRVDDGNEVTRYFTGGGCSGDRIYPDDGFLGQDTYPLTATTALVLVGPVHPIAFASTYDGGCAGTSGTLSGTTAFLDVPIPPAAAAPLTLG